MHTTHFLFLPLVCLPFIVFMGSSHHCFQTKRVRLLYHLLRPWFVVVTSPGKGLKQLFFGPQDATRGRLTNDALQVLITMLDRRFGFQLRICLSVWKVGSWLPASAYADLQQHRSDGVHRRPSPVSSYVPQPDYLEGDEDSDLIKPKKLINPVKASKSHQELHRELMSSCRRGGGSVEMKPELQRVLESRKRDQLIKQRKQEEEAHRKISPLEAELIKRHKKLEELEKQQEKQQEDNLRAPEFVKVKENLRRTSFHSKEEKEV